MNRDTCYLKWSQPLQNQQCFFDKKKGITISLFALRIKSVHFSQLNYSVLFVNTVHTL